MDESPLGPQYGIQIAVHTLRDRCRNLQQHVSLLEEENVNLRIKCSQNDNGKVSLNEVDYLRAQVAELSQQKGQLQYKVKLVTMENQELWGKLGKLTRVNKSLGNQLSKINETLTQHNENNVPCNNLPILSVHHNLIRSKTFTKSELQSKLVQKNLEENDKISLELEDISLKLSDSFSKQRKELDILCNEISEMTFSNNEEDISTDNCGFLFDEDLEDDAFTEIQALSDYFKLIKETVQQQQTVLELNIKNMNQLKENLNQKSSQCKKVQVEKSTSTIDLTVKKSFTNQCTETDDNDIGNKDNKSVNRSNNNNNTNKSRNATIPNEKICPICASLFSKDIEFEVFQMHVENHFLNDGNSQL